MGKKRPERENVERLILEDRKLKAYEVAKQLGLIDSMGYDSATNYVKSVKKSMKKKGMLPEDESRFAPDEDRLGDITTLFEIRNGKMSKRAAYYMLLLNCYYRLRSEDDKIHMAAIDDTYAKNTQLEKPFQLQEAIRICEKALSQYMRSKDEEADKAAKEKGYPGAGLNYTSSSLIIRCEITEKELPHMKSIRRG